MPPEPKGEKCPADVIGNAVKVMRIATGEEADAAPDDGKNPAAKALGARGATAPRNAPVSSRSRLKASRIKSTSAQPMTSRKT